MSERGVFAVDRGIWNDPDFPSEPFTEREAFLWLVSEAAWRPTKVRVGSRTIELERGQCSFSTRFMAAKFQWSEARVRRFLKRRSDLNQLCTKIDAGATQVTICKYDAFQRVGTVSDAPATQERRTSDAKKKQGNRETDTSEAIASSVPPKRASRIGDFQPDEAVGIELGLSPEQSRREAERFRDWALSAPGQKGMKQDWPATWRNWARRRADENAPSQQTGRPSNGQRYPNTGKPSIRDQIREGVRSVSAGDGLRGPVEASRDGRGAEWADDERPGGVASRTLTFERGEGRAFEDRPQHQSRYANARY